ncbi:MAG: hypothetical protein Q4A96_01490 [Candidatus Saccharibacteria bacterium]|nr:hypothetical protein [Candidatus Saccharibacteria bacterium]
MNKIAILGFIRWRALIAEAKDYIEKVFLDGFRSRGFTILDEVPSYPSTDPTVYFVGAQINQWKEKLDDLGYFANPQNCIRLQNMHLFYTDEAMRFCSCFRTEGAIAPADCFQQMLDAAITFLREIGVAEERICIKANRYLMELFESDREILLETEPTSYYRWTYGEEDLSGLGLTLAIRNKDTGEPYDIGNVIQISRNNYPIAVEWGFGLETLLTAILSEDCPIQFADLPIEALSLGDGNSKAYKMLDAILTLRHFAAYKIAPGKGGVNEMADSYCCGFAYQALVVNELSYSEAISLAIDVLKEAGNHYSILDRISFYLGRINYLLSLPPESDLDDKKLLKAVKLDRNLISRIRHEKQRTL